MLHRKKYVANRQGTIFKSLIITLKLPKAVASEKKKQLKNLATQVSSKALLKLASSNDTGI